MDPTAVFHEIDGHFVPHTIDRFASALNALFSRYNANWLDPSCEIVGALHLPDAHWREENNWCKTWPTLPDVLQNAFGAAAQQLHWSPPDGKDEHGTKHLPSCRITRRK
jgi:hypothetical protein